MTNAPDITIPRLEEETTRAYAARVEYLTLGASRSFDRMLERLQSGDKAGITKRRSTLAEWSSQYHWQEHARKYDETLATLAAQAHAEQYRQELEDHRKRYQKAGKDLYAVAHALIGACAQALRGQVIKGEDGKLYTIPGMEITPNTLAIAARALTTAGDLEAHALRIAELLPRLENDHE